MNKKKFLKLHSSDDNTVIIICVNEIILIYTDTVNGNKVTTVYFDNDEALIYEDEKVYLSGKVKLVFRGEMADGWFT